MPDTNLLADLTLEVTQLARLGGGKTPATVVVVAAGETTIVTPATGNLIRLLWVSAVPKTQVSGGVLVEPIISVHLGAAGPDRVTPYVVLAVAHWEPFDGPVDGPLIVELDVAATVAFTAHYVEVAP